MGSGSRCLPVSGTANRRPAWPMAGEGGLGWALALAPVGPTRPPVAWVVSNTHSDTWLVGDT